MVFMDEDGYGNEDEITNSKLFTTNAWNLES